jgi:hypothetical protein
MTDRSVHNHLRGWRVPIALGAAAVAGALLPLPPAAIERLYSSGFYRGLQPLLTSFSNRLPFPLFDALLITAVALWLALFARDFVRLRNAWLISRTVLGRTAIWAATGYLVFLATWGLNYRRVRLIDALRFDAARVTQESVNRAATIAVQRLNALYQPGHAIAGGQPEPAIDSALAAALQQALTEMGRQHPLVPGRPKRTILDPYFRRAGVDGMTDPYFLETLVATDVLPFERPFVIAHEWAHLAGINDEGEANFAGWLACLRAPPPAQYSGWLFLYRELGQSLPASVRTSIAAALAPGPRADLRAINERIRRNVNPRISAVGWTVYDSYLKANRIEAGAASYGEVVRLVVGTRLMSGREPLPE